VARDSAAGLKERYGAGSLEEVYFKTVASRLHRGEAE
jgi:hypothetical protein